MTIVNLKTNGKTFNASNFDTNFDILEALAVKNNDVLSIRYDCKTKEASLEILSNPENANDDFLDFVNSFEDNYNPTEYLIDQYQKYLYPFYNGDIMEDELVEYIVYRDTDQTICLLDKDKIEIKTSEDTGIIIDKFKNDKLIDTQTIFFDDYEQFPRFVIKVWETEELRDIGESIEVECHYTFVSAKAAAETIWNKNSYACVEVQDEINCYETMLHFS
ncbi:hypothetical protein [Sulfurimonas indica]|uniref:hypothetical protein n=1 Tax=Sulfurimonas TaxID=202746 RepID=UPI00126463CA|nr:hypothetical protein [Sulfurimonas indica]